MSRDLRSGKCRNCKAPVLVGMSDDQLAHLATVDPDPLTAVGEALARLDGRRTYALRRHGDKYRLAFTRNHWQIRSSQSTDYDIVADHACGQSLPTTLSVYRKVAVTIGVDNEPPF
jgi:hypothetical protein